MNRIIKIAAAAAILGLTGVAGTASAQQDIMVVRVGDLNTSSHQGAEVALRRIKNAASQFCGPQSRDLTTSSIQRRCEARMTEKAVSTLNAPKVTALYAPSQSIQLAQAETSSR
jgi:UrcA family protein